MPTDQFLGVGVHGRMNPDVGGTLEELQAERPLLGDRKLERDQMVDLISHHGAERRRAERFKVVPYEIPRGCAAAYYPETNVLVPVGKVAAGSNQPASKSIAITVEASA